MYLKVLLPKLNCRELIAVKNLQKLGTHAGNDAIVAFAKLHNVNVIIHQLNGKPLMVSEKCNNYLALLSFFTWHHCHSTLKNIEGVVRKNEVFFCQYIKLAHHYSHHKKTRLPSLHSGTLNF